MGIKEVTEFILAAADAIPGYVVTVRQGYYADIQSQKFEGLLVNIEPPSGNITPNYAPKAATNTASWNINFLLGCGANTPADNVVSGNSLSKAELIAEANAALEQFILNLMPKLSGVSKLEATPFQSGQVNGVQTLIGCGTRLNITYTFSSCN